MAEIAGYLGRWSALPGEQVSVHLWSSATVEAQVNLVRLGRGEQRAEVQGVACEPVAALVPQSLWLGPRTVAIGSYAEVLGLACLPLAQGCLGLLVQPWWTPGLGEQAVLALAGQCCGVKVLIDEQGAVALRVGAVTRTTGHRVKGRRWTLLMLNWSAQEVELTLMDLATSRGAATSLPAAQWPAQAHPLRGADGLTLAAAPSNDGSMGEHFDGRLERPLWWPTPQLLPAVREALLEQQGLPQGALAGWDFGPSPGSAAPDDLVHDLGPHGLMVRLFQGPRRAVRGARWSSRHFDWRQAPLEYGAVHFHRDDLLDALWPADTVIQLPEDLASGAYAVQVRAQEVQAGDLTGGLCRLPLFVRAGPGQRAAQPDAVALVFPTFTYLAYGNDRCALHGHNPEVLADRAITLEPTDVLLSQHPEWGLSLYDTHADGSGVGIASRRRPISNLQPDQRAWQAGEGSGRWNYPADLLLVEWLEREGIAWHALTDEDLHAGGAQVLAPYRVVLTGNHPEYATPALVKAYQEHVGHGGRLMYLGGNGFYWKVACHPHLEGVIELRRAEDGNRSWAEEPGEYFHAFDGEYGGLWRRSGLAPQAWLGVGYCGQGFRRSTGFQRAEGAARPEASFVFEGVPEQVFGLGGCMGGGCAGIEVDRRDEALGSDPQGWWLATSLPLDSTYLVANEEMLVSRPTLTAPFSPLLRADVVLQPVAGGGAVFSTGSIAWIGGLSGSQGDAAVQRITLNVVRRFQDPRPLSGSDQATRAPGP